MNNPSRKEERPRSGLPSNHPSQQNKVLMERNKYMNVVNPSNNNKYVMNNQNQRPVSGVQRQGVRPVTPDRMKPQMGVNRPVTPDRLKQQIGNNRPITPDRIKQQMGVNRPITPDRAKLQMGINRPVTPDRLKQQMGNNRPITPDRIKNNIRPQGNVGVGGGRMNPSYAPSNNRPRTPDMVQKNKQGQIVIKKR